MANDKELLRIERDGMELSIFRDDYDFKDQLVLAVSAVRGPDMYKFPISEAEARRLQACFGIRDGETIALTTRERV